MTKVTVKGYSTLTGKPEAILQLLRDAQVLKDLGIDDTAGQAAELLNELAKRGIIAVEQQEELHHGN